MTSKKVLLLGGEGQLGLSLQAEKATIRAAGFELAPFNSTEVDITAQDSLAAVFEQVRPICVVNAAAYTAVDKAEEETNKAYAVNGTAVKSITMLCNQYKSRLIHISTDFVFDGVHSTPYKPDDVANPVNLYGQSKRLGEVEALAAEKHLVLRTGWLYAEHGRNFLQTMLGLMASKSSLTVVADQIGTPTSAKGFARFIVGALSGEQSGIYHWGDAGSASWYDFAVAIQEEAVALGMLEKEIAITPIASEQYPTPAKRPNYSVLDKQKTWSDFDIRPIHWRKELRSILQAMNNNKKGD